MLHFISFTLIDFLGDKFSLNDEELSLDDNCFRLIILGEDNVFAFVASTWQTKAYKILTEWNFICVENGASIIQQFGFL